MSKSFWNLIRDPLFRIDGKEVTFHRRGFQVSSPTAQTHLEQIGTSFLFGYHLAIDSRDMTELSETLSACDAEYQGFSYEGAAMGLGLLDALSVRNKRRWHRFLEGPAQSTSIRRACGIGMGAGSASLASISTRASLEEARSFIEVACAGWIWISRGILPLEEMVAGNQATSSLYRLCFPSVRSGPWSLPVVCLGQ